MLQYNSAIMLRSYCTPTLQRFKSLPHALKHYDAIKLQIQLVDSMTFADYIGIIDFDDDARTFLGTHMSVLYLVSVS